MQHEHSVHLYIYETMKEPRGALQSPVSARSATPGHPLLRVFKSVADCGGMAAAELDLNIGRPPSVATEGIFEDRSTAVPAWPGLLRSPTRGGACMRIYRTLARGAGVLLPTGAARRAHGHRRACLFDKTQEQPGCAH